MANTFIIALLLLICVHRMKSQCLDIITHTDCGDNQICSKYDLQCYSAFNASDYDSIYLGQSSDINGPFTEMAGLDFSLIVDGDAATSVSVPGAFKFHDLQFVFPSTGYWVHGISIVMSIQPTVMEFRVNGELQTLEYTTTTTTTATPTVAFPFPTTIYNVTFISMDQSAINWYSVNIYGAYSTPLPSASPTKPPTDATMSPTAAPSSSPSDAPSLSPTRYPTPDVCEEYIVKQPCCGRYGFIEEEDKTNLRDPTLLTCEYTFTDQCCGTKGGWGITPDKKFYGCGGQFDNNICDSSFYNTSINTTDNLYGPVVSTKTHLDTSGTRSEILNVDNGYCTCNWTVYECTGTDMAVCGTMQEYDDLFNMNCWNNDTDWSYDDDFSNESCWKQTVANDASYEHLLWEPCGTDSFIGDVTDVVNVTNEIIYEGGCTCSYRIRDCHVLEDQSKTACNKDYDCADGEQCEQELAKPCCGYDDYSSGTYQGVTPTLDSNNNPIDGGWTCNNNESTPLCPDIFNSTRLYTATPRVDWWYDMETNTTNSRCGCLYATDECNLPTSSPSVDPTKGPSAGPTSEPTEEADHASTIMISYMAVVAILIIPLFV